MSFKEKNHNKLFSEVAQKVTKFTGTSIAFIGAIILVLGWAVTGPIFHWSEMHSLVINTITTIITFLMVFLIQHSQNKNDLAMHLKMDALIKALKEVDNKYSGVEDLSEEELSEVKEELKD